MTIMVVYSGPGVGRDAYRPYEADIQSGPVPAEALIHQVAFDGDNLFVVDIWSSRPAFEAWTESRIKPTLARHGIDYVEPKVLEVDTVATQDAIDQFKILKLRAVAPA